ncbi:glycoside hydrolase family 2 protein [Chitinophaga rhizophila]|uniref:Beta-glucuronidase n=1 Tax=Chitinophaga rhizophila TaxID=2866212 RepID=A0ABS7GNC0_9BACT|nr:glycoside hydrolase family 2 TIM barrel-domain containing protein [Chitinophaga rhizophila]MBW8688318.1 hypothetical protein [Chitinophaga rhizophila]
MRRFLFSLVFILSGLSLYSQSPQDVSLNGTWSFITDKDAVGLQSGYPGGLPPAAIQVPVPGTWNILAGLEDYQGTAWYHKKFVAGKDWATKRVLLHFGAVYHDAVVFVNGKKAGEHLNAGYTRFTLEISAFLKPGASNDIVVSVSNQLSAVNLPYMASFDWPNDGGITRDVSLHITDALAISQVRVTPSVDFRDSTGAATVSVALFGAAPDAADLSFVLKEKKSGKVLFDGKKSVVNKDHTFTFDIPKGKVTPWHFDHPFLYELTVTAHAKGKVSDRKTVRFGYRTVEIKGNQLLLNKEPVRLPGIEYMPGSNPQYGAAEPREYIDTVVRLMKRMNIVITRFHWQQDEAWLDLMDEAGILVQEEIPWWQAPAKLTPALMTTAQQHLNEMIRAHYNHPCIFAWGINNEVRSTQADNQALKTFAHNLDNTRMVTVIGNHLDTNLEKDPSLMADLPTWNEYVGTWNKAKREDLPGKFNNIEKVLDNRPLLITEHGLCEPAFTGGDARRADDMLYHINEWRKQPFIAGFIYFCLNDYRTQMGEEGIGKFRIRRHGVADASLQPKATLSILQQLCSPVDITKVVKNSETAADIAIMVKHTIPSYTLRGYVLEYRTKAGDMQKIPLADLKPGDTAAFQLKDVNVRYAFEIKRPTGEVVVAY